MLRSRLHDLAGAEIDFERLAFLVGEIGKTAVEHGLGGRDKLDHDGIAFGNGGIDGRQQARQLHGQEELREEALLRALEDRERRGLRTAVECATGFPINDAGGFEGLAEVCMDDGLSRGGDNAKERGVGAQCRETDHHVLRIISQGVEPLHQTGISLPRRWNVARRRRTHQLQGLSFGLQIGLCVVVGRVEADVSQPTANDGDVDPGSDKVNGCRVPEAVRRHMF